MTDVPEVNTKLEQEKLVSELYRTKLTEALRTLSRVADAKTMERVPLARIANPLSTWTKIKIAVRRFLPGFLFGALGFLTESVTRGGVAAFNVGTLIGAAGVGAMSGLGLTAVKYVKETALDTRLDKEVRAPEIARQEGYNTATLDYLSTIVTVVMKIAQAAGLDTATSLRHVYTDMALLGHVPLEVGEFLLTLSTVVEDGTARGGFTAEEIQSVLKEAHDVKDAISRIHELWDER